MILKLVSAVRLGWKVETDNHVFLLTKKKIRFVFLAGDCTFKLAWGPIDPIFQNSGLSVKINASGNSDTQAFSNSIQLSQATIDGGQLTSWNSDTQTSLVFFGTNFVSSMTVLAVNSSGSPLPGGGVTGECFCFRKRIKSNRKNKHSNCDSLSVVQYISGYLCHY